MKVDGPRSKTGVRSVHRAFTFDLAKIAAEEIHARINPHLDEVAFHPDFQRPVYFDLRACGNNGEVFSRRI